MSDPRLRRLIALEAARLMYEGQVGEYYVAKRKAALRLRIDPRPKDLPSNAEIRAAILEQARLLEGGSREERLRAMRLCALALMGHLESFRPRLIGSVLTGHVRSGSDIDLHVFSRSVDPLCGVLDELGLTHTVEHKRVGVHGQGGGERIFTHVHVDTEFPVELTVYAPERASFRCQSSITGRPIEKAPTAELERLMGEWYPDLDLEAAGGAAEPEYDALRIFRLLLLPLEDVKQSPRYHPEGDALFHSLQVYDLVKAEAPWDVELQLAGLLHDVGKAVDRHDHVAAGVAAVEGLVTDRTRWLIAEHMRGGAYLDGALPARQRRRLAANEWWEDLLLLARCDKAGRVPGVEVTELDDVLAELRELQLELGRWDAM